MRCNRIHRIVRQSEARDRADRRLGRSEVERLIKTRSGIASDAEEEVRIEDDCLRILIRLDHVGLVDEEERLLSLHGNEELERISRGDHERIVVE